MMKRLIPHSVLWAALLPAALLLLPGVARAQASHTASLERADAVRQALIGRGVPASRIRAIGRGESVPVADNGSESGRARNRRVEIYLE